MPGRLDTDPELGVNNQDLVALKGLIKHVEVRLSDRLSLEFQSVNEKLDGLANEANAVDTRVRSLEIENPRGTSIKLDQQVAENTRQISELRIKVETDALKLKIGGAIGAMIVSGIVSALIHFLTVR